MGFYEQFETVKVRSRQLSQGRTEVSAFLPSRGDDKACCVSTAPNYAQAGVLKHVENSIPFPEPIWDG